MQRFIRGAFLLLPLIACAAASGQEVTFPDERFAHDQQRPAAGHWVGTMTLPGGSQSFGAILIEPVEGGEWSAQITCLPVAALRTPATAVQVGEGTIELTLESPRASLRFSGRVGDEGQRLHGTIEPLHEDEGEVGAGPGRFELGRLPRPVDMPEAVSYRGSIQTMRMTFVFAETPGGHTVGHLDIPVQGLHGFPLINVEREGDEIVATIPSWPVSGRLEATIGERLTGHFKQGPVNIPIDFAPPGDPAADAPPARPQHPQPPFPYGQREITVARDGFKLAGTLTTPDPAQWPPPWPAAVLISGSGQQDRDETLLGHKPFLVIADHLTRHGIAVMRYDDRGVGGSTVEDPELVSDATSADFAGDTAAIVDGLRDEVNIDPDRVGLIGHSEGGIIAPMVARDDPRLAFIVLLAAPGVPGSELLPLQLELVMKAAGVPPEGAAAYRAAMAHAIELVLAEAGDEAIEQAMRAAASASIGGSDLPESQLDALVEGHEALLTNPWMRWFLAHDPLPVLAAVRCPVFAANGALDLQVWHEQNLAAIERMAKERGIDLTARLYQGLNHLFQPATTGSGIEYAEIETTFDERVLRDVVAWIHERANVKSPSGAEIRPAAEPAPSDSR